MTMLSVSGELFAVKIECPDGRTWLAHGNNDIKVSLYKTRGAARSYKTELRKHLGRKTKLTVVPVSFEIKEIKS